MKAKKALLIAFVILVEFVSESNTNGLVGYERKLAGSNCVIIERGKAPRYYKCIGCVIEEATACVDDLRSNKSKNSPTGCDMTSLMGVYESTQCCPRFFTDTDGRRNLKFMGSAYPLAIHCIEKVGCTDTTIYNELVEECQTVCNGQLDQTGKDACFATFNSASALRLSIFVPLFTTFVGILLFFT